MISYVNLFARTSISICFLKRFARPSLLRQWLDGGDSRYNVAGRASRLDGNRLLHRPFGAGED